MLQAKLAGREFRTEYPIPRFDRVAPGDALSDLSGAKVGLVTSGGIVEAGNPDHIEASSARKFGEYSLAGIDRLTPETHRCVHGGYDATYANQDPNRVLPVDVLRDMERKELIGGLHDLYYATVGNGTSVGNARRFGAEIAERLQSAGVQLVILTST
jgi:glycine reductase